MGDKRPRRPETTTSNFTGGHLGDMGQRCSTVTEFAPVGRPGRKDPTAVLAPLLAWPAQLLEPDSSVRPDVAQPRAGDVFDAKGADLEHPDGRSCVSFVRELLEEGAV